MRRRTILVSILACMLVMTSVSGCGHKEKEAEVVVPVIEKISEEPTEQSTDTVTVTFIRGICCPDPRPPR